MLYFGERFPGKAESGVVGVRKAAGSRTVHFFEGARNASERGRELFDRAPLGRIRLRTE